MPVAVRKWSFWRSFPSFVVVYGLFLRKPPPATEPFRALRARNPKRVKTSQKESLLTLFGLFGSLGPGGPGRLFFGSFLTLLGFRARRARNGSVVGGGFLKPISRLIHVASPLVVLLVLPLFCRHLGCFGETPKGKNGSIACVKHRQVTDLDVTDLGFSGPRIPFCATGALWGRVTPFSRSLF